MTAPVTMRAAALVRQRGAHPASPTPVTDLTRGLRRMERKTALAGLGLVLDDLGGRYPELSPSVIRQQAVEVLCLAAADRLTPALVGRVVEARLLALL